MTVCMAKRFTDSEKWKNPFLRKLKPAYKLLWLYLLDECDHAGVWRLDLEVAQVKLGIELDEQEALAQFGDRITPIGEDYWFIKDFPNFQYGPLNPSSKIHKSVIIRLEKLQKGLSNPYLNPLETLSKPFANPLDTLTEPLAIELPKSSLTLKDKDKDKDKVLSIDDINTNARTHEKQKHKELFEKFWNEFQNKQARKEAESAWDKLTEEEMLLAIAAARPYHERIKREGGIQKFGQGWLNGKRWNDAPPAPNQKQETSEFQFRKPLYTKQDTDI